MVFFFIHYWRSCWHIETPPQISVYLNFKLKYNNLFAHLIFTISHTHTNQLYYHLALEKNGQQLSTIFQVTCMEIWSPTTWPLLDDHLGRETERERKREEGWRELVAISLFSSPSQALVYHPIMWIHKQSHAAPILTSMVLSLLIHLPSTAFLFGMPKASSSE